LDVDSYSTYPRSRCPPRLGDLREEVTRVSMVATTLLLVVSITDVEKEEEDERSATATFKIRIQ
jgi:hypothetical protein